MYGSVKCSVYMYLKCVATGALGGSDLMSVSSARVCVPDSSGSECLGTSVTMTLGPGIMDCMYDNVCVTSEVSGRESCETGTVVVAC